MADRAALRLTLALPGLPALSVGLSRLRTDISDWTTFWRERFAPFFYYTIQQDFVLEGGASGTSWAALSPAYAAWKRKQFPGKGILVRSGALKASLASKDAAGAIFRATPTDLEVGTSVPYARYHQYGTRERIGFLQLGTLGSGMPQRPPMRVNAAFMGVVGKDLQKFVQDAWKERRKDFAADVQSGLNSGLA